MASREHDDRKLTPMEASATEHEDHLLVEEVDDKEEMYDADVEVVEPDEYEEPESEDEAATPEPSPSADGDSDWQQHVLRGLQRLDCDSGSVTGSSRPGSSGQKRKAEDDLEFFRKKQLRSRSPSPHVEIEEVPSDAPKQLRRIKVIRQRPRPGPIQTTAALLRQDQEPNSPVSIPSSPLSRLAFANSSNANVKMDVD